VATTTIALKNAAVVMNTTVDLSDQVQSVTLTVGFDQLETTAMGASGRSYTKGLQSVDVSMTLFNSYGAAEVEASLEDVVGDDAVTLEIYPDGTSPGTYHRRIPHLVHPDHRHRRRPVHGHGDIHRRHLGPSHSLIQLGARQHDWNRPQSHTFGRQ